ncbi:MAG: ammonium transporter [Phycisphaerales bacterium]|nr:ammonium transporter [Phycisphaerales bacterium]
MKVLSLSKNAVPALFAIALLATQVIGQEGVTAEDAAMLSPATPIEVGAYEIANNLWLIIATALVFIMHLGFACLETGLTRAKNTVNILFKNVGIGILTYAMIGFSLMYPGEGHAGAWFGFGGLGIAPPEDYNPATYADGAYTYWTEFLFQGMFAATAATIVSGAVAERIKLGPFLAFSAVYVAIVYPIVGMWHWGGGWLAAEGFHDFAGSTIVHSVGGWGALAGVLVLGPRIGKYVKGGDGRTVVRPYMGHSMPLAAIGVFLLWFGWFGFNGGSVLSADPESISYVLVTTTLAAAAGIFGAMFTSWVVQKEPDLSMILNGILAGLVGITAGADVVGVMDAVLIGLIAGVLVVLSVVALDRARVDDPVGAISVHLVCGIWGTLAVGVFAAEKSFATQLLGVGVIGAACFTMALLIFATLRYTVGIRVSRTDELRGLDISEHGMEAYTGFQIFTVQ